jgi:hypothetical protein
MPEFKFWIHRVFSYEVFFLVCFSSFSLGGEIDKNNSKSDLLSINECEFYYDNKKFDFEWSVDRITKVLGESEQFYESEEFGTKVMYISWESIGITIRKYHYEDGRELSVFYIDLVEDDYSYYKWYRYENEWPVDRIYSETTNNFGNAYPYNGFFFDGKKIKPGIGYKDFFDLYGYDLKDFEIKGKSYLLKRSCEDDRSIYFDIGQGGGWTYKGSGHLMYKDKYIPVGSHSIRSIYIRYE